MRTEFLSVSKNLPVEELAELLESHPYTAVTDGDDFMGLITRADFLNYVRRQMQV